jgi:hypothetical protein
MNAQSNIEKPSIYDLITLRQASKISGFTTSHLRRLLGSKKIWGIKIDSIWLTTRSAIDNYINSKPKPGPKPNETL